MDLPAAAPGREGIPMLEPTESCTGRSGQQPLGPLSGQRCGSLSSTQGTFFTNAIEMNPLGGLHRPAKPGRSRLLGFEAIAGKMAKSTTRHTTFNEETGLKAYSDPHRNERGETEKRWKTKPLPWL